MTRSQSLLGVLLLVLTALTLTWQSSRADDDQSSAKATSILSGSSEEKLIERIEALEQRISKLERLETLVRQADNSLSPAVPAPRELPAITPDEGQPPQQKTNGTTWSFRTLSHRRTSNIVR